MGPSPSLQSSASDRSPAARIGPSGASPQLPPPALPPVRPTPPANLWGVSSYLAWHSAKPGSAWPCTTCSSGSRTALWPVCCGGCGARPCTGLGLTGCRARWGGGLGRRGLGRPGGTLPGLHAAARCPPKGGRDCPPRSTTGAPGEIGGQGVHRTPERAGPWQPAQASASRLRRTPQDPRPCAPDPALLSTPSM